MNNVRALPTKPFYLRAKVRVSRAGYFGVEGFVFFGPFRTESATQAWYQELTKHLESVREHGSMVLEISLGGFTIERDQANIYYLHNIEKERIEETASLVPNLLMRETHLAYQLLSAMRSENGKSAT